MHSGLSEWAGALRVWAVLVLAAQNTDLADMQMHARSHDPVGEATNRSHTA